MARVVLVDPLTLLGKEVRDRAAEILGPGHDVRLVAADPQQAGTLTDLGGAAAVVTGSGKTPAETLEGTDLAIFCGDAADAPEFIAAMAPGSTAILFGAEAAGTPIVAGVNDERAGAGTLLSPPAAAVALAHFAAAVRELGLEELIATTILPASEHGDAGLHEVFEQTRAIVAFTAQPPATVFGRQLAFNLLPLVDGGAGIEAALRAVLGDSPAVRVQSVQGGIFHGVSLSLALRFVTDPGEEAIRQALAAHPPIESFDEPAVLGPIDSAQSDGLLAGGLRRDPRDARLYWLWAALDNLTVGGAINALRVARSVLGS